MQDQKSSSKKDFHSQKWEKLIETKKDSGQDSILEEPAIKKLEPCSSIIPGLINFSESIGLLHLCRLVFKYIGLRKCLLKHISTSFQ